MVVTADSTLRYLEKVQIAFLRRLLHVHKCSMTSILFSETGFIPLRYRRLILTLRYLLSLLSIRHTSSKLAPLGIDTCEALWQQGKRNRLGDSANALQHLYRPIVATLNDSSSTERVNDLVSSVDSMWKETKIQTVPIMASFLLRYSSVIIQFHLSIVSITTTIHPLFVGRYGRRRYWSISTQCR